MERPRTWLSYHPVSCAPTVGQKPKKTLPKTAKQAETKRQFSQNGKRAEVSPVSDSRSEIMKAIADPDYNKSGYADDDGIIRIGSSFKDVWEWLDEQVESTYSSSLVK